MATLDAMVLAAGAGSRLAPLTDHMAKPLIPIVGKTLLRRAVERAADAKPGRIVVNAHYHRAAIVDAVKNMDGISCPLLPSEEDIVLGPMGGIRHALPLFEADWLLVINADAYLDQFPPALRPVIANPQHPVTFLTTRHGDKAPQVLGVDEKGFVVSARGNGPGAGHEAGFCGFLGVSLWHLPTLRPVMDALKDVTPLDLTPHVLPELFRRTIPIATLPHLGYFQDAGTPQRLLQLQRDILEGKTGEVVEFPQRSPGIFIGPFAAVDPTAKLIPPVYIEPHARVGAGAKLGPNVGVQQESIIAEGTTLTESMVFKETQLCLRAHPSENP